jgi:hypothetical protein
MSTEHERALNRAKQRRFQLRHFPQLMEERELRRARRPPSLRSCSFRTFELLDPRTDQLRIVGCCKTPGRPWAGLWSVRYVSRSRWAAWLRELDALNLEPKEQFGWAVGIAHPVTYTCARLLVDLRVRQINEATTGSQRIAPLWLLRLPQGFQYLTPAGQEPRRRLTPVGRVHVDGRIERYPTTTHAKQIVRTYLVNDYVFLAATVNGWTWFDDGDGSECSSII